MTPVRFSTPAVVGIAIALGAIVGLAYTLSPLTIICGAALIWTVQWGSRDLTPTERRWFIAIVALAIVGRVILIGGLFMSADGSLPYATFFGDEELFKNRSLWLRNLALGMTVSPADIIYAMEATGWSSYQLVLGLVQALVGNAPYGAHMLNVTLFTLSVVTLFKLARPAFGALASFAGLAVLLYLPSLFLWSASALKEPLYIAVAVLELVCVLAVVRGRAVSHRVLGVAGILVAAFVLESVRKGGALVTLLGSAMGLAATYALPRPRVLVAALVAVPLVVLVVLSNGRVQEQLLRQGRIAAAYHAGHVLTVGYSYELLDPRYYEDRVLLLRTMTRREAANFAVRSVASYFAEPMPWKGDSIFLRAYVPEQMLWWTLVLLLPFGIIAGLRADLALTAVLCAHAAMMVLVVALTSGNAGTLVRHRGLVLPYVVWLSALGGVSIARRMMAGRESLLQSEGTHGDR